MFESALQEVLDIEDFGDRPREDYPRLHRTAGYARRVADSVGESNFAARIDRAVADAFPEDAEEPLPSTVAEHSLVRRQLERAKRSGNFRKAVQLARFVGDDEILTEVLRDRIAEGKYADGLVTAWFSLDESAFRRLVTPVASTLKDDASAFLAFLAGSPHLIPAMEERLGQEFIAVGELIELINQGDESYNRVSPGGARVLPGVWRYVQAKGTLDEQIAFLAVVAGAGRIRPPDVALVVGDLLAVELSGEQRTALTDAATVYLAKQDVSSPFALATYMQFLLQDIHSGNVGAVYAMAEHLVDRSSTEVDLVRVMTDIHEGTPKRRFEGLVELSKAQLWRFGMGYNRAIGHWFDDERERILRAVDQGEAIPSEKAALVYELTFPGFGPTPREQLVRQAALAPRFAALDPKGANQYLLRGINALLDLGAWSAAERALHDFYRENPEDEFVRAALYFRLLGEGKFEQALAVATDGGADLRDQTVVDALLDRMSRSGGVSRGLFRRFYRGPMPRNSYGGYTPVVQRSMDRLKEAAAAPAGLATSSTDSRNADTAPSRTPASIVESLRAVWRGMTAPGGDGDRRYYPASPGSLLSTPLADRSSNAWRSGPSAGLGAISGLLAPTRGEGDERRLFDVLVQMPDVVDELERFVPSLPEYERRNQTRCYELLADALDAAGLAVRRRADLSSRLRRGAISNHDFTLWMTLRHREEDDLSVAEREILATRATEIEDPTRSELLLIARLFAKAGAYADAAEHYALVLSNVFRPAGQGSVTTRVMMQGVAMQVISSSMRVISSGVTYSSPDLAEILAETAERLPPEIAEDFARRVLSVARPSEDDEALAAIFDAFVLKTMANVLPAPAALAESAAISPSATATEMPLETWHVPKVLQLIRLHAMAGNSVEALGLIRRFVVPGGLNTEREADLFDAEQARRAGTASGLARAFGLQLIHGYEPTLPASWLVHGRERIFPAESDEAWPGAADWMQTALRAMQGWLDDEDVDRANIRELLFVMAWQLGEADQGDTARQVLGVLARELAAETDPDPLELKNLALMSLRLGSALPVDLAVAAVSAGTLSTDQEVRLVRELAGSDALAALRTGRAADQSDKLELLRELHPLAVAANDMAYAADLEARLEAAEAAYRELGSPTLPREGAWRSVQ